jgi:diacylglycerol O-acyltransferase
MAGYERLAALDRFFLDMERHHTHMHVAAVMTFDAGPLQNDAGGIDIDSVRRYIASRLHLIPRYRQRLAYTPIENHPVWVDDDRLNIHYHVRHASLPRPGAVRQLKRLAGRIMSQKLDRSRPLWEIWVVEGLEDDRFALITKTHHCMIDGVSGVDLMAVLLGITPESEIEAPPTWSPEAAPSTLELLRDEAWRRMRTPFEMAAATAGLLAHPRQVCGQVSEAASGLRQALGVGFKGSADTPLNRTIGAYRRFDWATFDLAAVKRVKKELGGTVNDVVLATVAGTIGRFLERRGITVPQQEDMDFRAFCPVSVRDPSERGRLGNRVSGMIASLPIAERDPRVRLAAVRETTAQLKSTNQALGAEVLTAVSEWTVPTLLALGARLATRARAYNMIVTNVPGPQVPLYLLRARLLEAFPLVPLFGNQAVGVALFSYDGQLCWGFNADWDLLPDLHDMIAALQDSFEELVLAASSRPMAVNGAEESPPGGNGRHPPAPAAH